MFLEVVHINGRYDPETRLHCPPAGADTVLPMLQSVTQEAVGLGHDVLYKPNLNGNAARIIPDPLERSYALASDPYLSGLDDRTRSKVMVRFDGADVPLDYLRQTHMLEDESAKKHKLGYILGAFTSACVVFVANNIQARNPDSSIYIDTNLCVEWPGLPINYCFDTGNVVLKNLVIPTAELSQK